MTRRRTSLRRVTFASIAAFAVVLALLLHALGVMQPLEFASVDARFDARGARSPARSGVAIVAIDDKTYGALGRQWPYPRSLHAKVMDRLKAAGATVIAYDVEFVVESKPSEDKALINAIDRDRPVVLTAGNVLEDGTAAVLGGGDFIATLGGRAGHSGFVPDAAEVFRTVPHTFDGLETFAVATAEVADGRPVGTARFTEADASAWIDFAGPPGSIPTVPFDHVLSGDFDASIFKGRIVVVGASAAFLQDNHPTATTSGHSLMSGPEIQANAIETVRRGLPLQSLPPWAEVALIALLSAAVPLMALIVPFRFALFGGVALGAAFLVAAKFAFDGGAVLPVVVPLVGLGLATVTSTAGYALLTAAERQRTRDLFARFVPEAVVNDVLAKADDDLRLGGQRKEGTVMFCDLRGFTSFAERLEPDRVIEVLNQYLSEMSDAIMEQEGTLVAFMGDGIMAVFGAPLDRADHADRAVRAAREMVDVRLPRFNAWLEGQGLEHTFRMGIGINSGPVMSGNVGSSTRVEYTAIGDTTNTASRIEAMTKDEDAQVLLSEATRAALLDETRRAALRSVGERAVRGRDQRIVLWTLAP